MISHTYQSVTNEDYKAGKVKAHEVQKIGTCLFFRKNCAVQQVLTAGMWFADCLLSLLALRCYPQAYGHLFQ